MTSAAQSHTLYRHLAAPESTGEEAVWKEEGFDNTGLKTNQSQAADAASSLASEGSTHTQKSMFLLLLDQDILIIPVGRVMKLQKEDIASLLWFSGRRLRFQTHQNPEKKHCNPTREC